MKTIHEFDLTVATLRFARPLDAGDATRARGFCGRRFPDCVPLHHHRGERLVYTYPRVQFKVIDGDLIVWGVAEGATLARRVADVSEWQLGDEPLVSIQRDVSSSRAELGTCQKPVGYEFVSPWLALNQANHRRYMRSNEGARRGLLRRILIGNMLSMARCLGPVIGEEIRVRLDVLPGNVSHKGTDMLGFLGHFKANCVLPPLSGLGKGVARGFGTVSLRDGFALGDAGSSG